VIIFYGIGSWVENYHLRCQFSAGDCFFETTMISPVRKSGMKAIERQSQNKKPGWKTSLASF
jgi:hypothetical protein